MVPSGDIGFLQCNKTDCNDITYFLKVALKTHSSVTHDFQFECSPWWDVFDPAFYDKIR
jgi:hypothetical protein